MNCFCALSPATFNLLRSYLAITKCQLLFQAMVSRTLHEAVPAFPEDVPTAPMYTISLESLTSGNSSTARSILQACQELGFFVLDLRGDTLGEIVIDEIDRLFRAGEEIMDLPGEVKAKFEHDIPKSFLGYTASPSDSFRN